MKGNSFWYEEKTLSEEIQMQDEDDREQFLSQFARFTRKLGEAGTDEDDS